jgi:hypothetical protein
MVYCEPRVPVLPVQPVVPQGNSPVLSVNNSMLFAQPRSEFARGLRGHCVFAVCCETVEAAPRSPPA